MGSESLYLIKSTSQIILYSAGGTLLSRGLNCEEKNQEEKIEEIIVGG